MTKQFLHHLRDTIIILGGGTYIANMAENAESATEHDIDELRRFNLKLIDTTKRRLENMNSLTVKTEQNGP